MDNLTIGIVLPYLKSRGTEKQTLALAKGFLAKGATVIVFNVQGWGLDSMYRAFRDAGVEVINVGFPLDEGGKSVSSARILGLASKVRKYGCSVLLSRAGMTNKITGYAGILSRIPVVSVASGAIAKPEGRRNFKKILRTLRTAHNYGLPRRLVTVSEEGAENLAAAHPWFSKRVVAIRNGVDIPDKKSLAEPALRLNPDKFWLCTSGSLEIKRKGMDILVASMAELVHHHKKLNMGLVFIGTGEDEDNLHQMVQASRLEQHVIFAGEQLNPRSIMNQCHVFVLPSRREGLPNALLEAMSLGLCSVAADCDTGPREVVTHEMDGLLATVGDSHSLTIAILRIVEDNHLRNRLGENGKLTIKDKFSYQKMVEGYYNLLRSLV
ncbi:MAG: glycosyltransferase [Pseudomonadota bacterium]